LSAIGVYKIEHPGLSERFTLELTIRILDFAPPMVGKIGTEFGL